MDIISLLSSDGYIVVNKVVAKEFGLQAAVLIGELCSEHRYWELQDKLEDGYFFSTQENIENNTTIGASQQKRIIDKLEEEGIISTKLKGLPAKKYYKINQSSLFALFDDTRIAKSSKLESPNQVTNNNKETIINKEEGIITINSNNMNFGDDVESKLYSENDFLGSGKKEKKPKKNLFSKCVDEIDQFTQNLELRTILVTYLEFRLAVKDKPIYGVPQWKGLLNKLMTLGKEEEYVEIVQQSLDKCWLSFYALKSFNNKTDVFSEYGEVSCEKKEDEVYVDRVF